MTNSASAPRPARWESRSRNIAGTRATNFITPWMSMRGPATGTDSKREAGHGYVVALFAAARADLHGLPPALVRPGDAGPGAVARAGELPRRRSLLRKLGRSLPIVP